MFIKRKAEAAWSGVTSISKKQKRSHFALICFIEKDLEPLAAVARQKKKSGSGLVRGDKLFRENRSVNQSLIVVKFNTVCFIIRLLS
jgi:hypothetical protein